MSEFAAALAKAQAEMKNASLNKVNPRFESKYADLPGIRDAVLPILNRHGFAVVQTTRVVDGALMLVTKLIHATGEIEGEYPLPIAKPQEMGSAITYARRYTLAALACIAADEDDDGEAAKDMTAKAPQKPAQRGNIERAYHACVDALWGAMPCAPDEFDRWCHSATEAEAEDAGSSLFQAWTAVNGSADLKSLPERERNEIIAIKDHIKAGIASVKQAKRAA